MAVKALSASRPARDHRATAFAVRSDGAFVGTNAIAVLGSFTSGMFIPLEQMGRFWADLAPWTPFYSWCRWCNPRSTVGNISRGYGQ